MSAGWTAIATGAAVGPRGRIRVQVDGGEFVLWRGGDGTARVFGNRCPHRGMRLSFGFVRGSTLICPYHGWHYGGDGRCVSIPAHPDIDPPATIRVDTLEVAEAAGLVFVRTGGPVTLSDLPAGAAEAFEPCRSIHVDGDVDRLADGLLSGLPAGWSAQRGAIATIDGKSAAGIAFTALLAFHRPEPGVAAVHVSVSSADATARVGVARWLADRRDLIEGSDR